MRSLLFGIGCGVALWVWGSGFHPPHSTTQFLSCVVVGVIVFTPVHWLE